MKAYVKGFRCSAAAAHSVKDFLDSLVSDRFDKIKLYDIERLVKLISTRDYYQGVVITNKGHDEYPTFTIDPRTGDIKAHIHPTQEGELLADFNYFVIAKHSMCGAMTTYNGSGGGPHFLGELYNSKYQPVVHRMQETELDDLDRDSFSKKKDYDTAAKDIRAKYRGAKFKCVALFSEEDFFEQVPKLDTVNAIEYVENELTSERHLSQQIKQVQKKVVFKQDREGNWADRLKRFALSKGRARGTGEVVVVKGRMNANAIRISINPSVANFKDLHYKDIVKTENLKFSTLGDCPVMDVLQRVIQENKRQFGLS